MPRFRWILILIFFLPNAFLTSAQDEYELGRSGAIDVISGGRHYQSALTAPNHGAPHPGIILLPSSQGTQSWEYGFTTLRQNLARQGYVVLALGWQTFEQHPDEAVMKQLIEAGIAVLREQSDVIPDRIGLVGFGEGADFTLQLLPQLTGVNVAVAFYGTPPEADTMPSTTVPLLLIHGANDEVSPIAAIFEYAVLLDAAAMPFELKVYSDEAHGFMLRDGLLREDALAQDAFNEIVNFLNRHLR